MKVVLTVLVLTARRTNPFRAAKVQNIYRKTEIYINQNQYATQYLTKYNDYSFILRVIKLQWKS